MHRNSLAEDILPDTIEASNVESSIDIEDSLPERFVWVKLFIVNDLLVTDKVGSSSIG